MAGEQCYRCNSTYRVAEFGSSGIYTCAGFCKKLLEAKGASPAPAEEPKTPEPAAKITPVSTPKALKSASPSFRVGALCRANCKAEGGLLEASVLEVSGSGGSSVVKVKFLGSEVEETLTMRELLPSSGSASRDKQIERFSQGRGWKVDDFCRAKFSGDGVVYSARIKAIEGSEVEVIYEEYGNSEKKSLSELLPEWKVGDYCRTVYTEDSVEYEGKITEIGESEGAKYCTVEFIGYGNVETAWLSAIKDSKGEESRKIQGQQAGVYKVGDHCRAVFPVDGKEYEGDVIAVDKDENNNKFCTVKFLGYGNEETIWMQDMKPSSGKEARDAQLGPLDKGDAPASVKKPDWKVDDYCRCIYFEDEKEYEGQVKEVHESEGTAYFTVEFVGFGNQESIWLADMKPSNGPEAREEQLRLALESSETADAIEKPVEVEVEETVIEFVEEVSPEPPSREWKVGDVCRAIYAEDGQEYEVTIKEINVEGTDKYATVLFVGYGNEETVWCSDLMESHGDIAPKETEAIDQAHEPDDSGVVDDKKDDSDVMVNGKTDGAAVEDKEPEKPWNVGDFCTVNYNASGDSGVSISSVGSGMFEGVIYSIDEKTGDISVRIIGLNDVFKSCTATDLKASVGSESREKQVLGFRNEKVTPSPSKSEMSAQRTAAPSAKVTTVSGTSFSSTEEGLALACQLVNRLHEALDFEKVNADLAQRLEENRLLVERLKADLESVTMDNDALKRGNKELYKLVNSGPSDVVEVAVENMNILKFKLEHLEKKYAERMDISAKDERSLLNKVEVLKVENNHMKREVLQVKAEKQEILNEYISLKATVVGGK